MTDTPAVTHTTPTLAYTTPCVTARHSLPLLCFVIALEQMGPALSLAKLDGIQFLRNMHVMAPNCRSRALGE